MEFLAVNQHLRSVDRNAQVQAYLHTVPGYAKAHATAAPFAVTLSDDELDNLDSVCIENDVQAHIASKLALREHRYADAHRHVADAISWTCAISDRHTKLARESNAVATMQSHAVCLRNLSLAIYYQEAAAENERRALNARLLGRYDSVETFATEALLLFSLYREHAMQYNAMLGEELSRDLQPQEILPRCWVLGGILDTSMKNKHRMDQFLRENRIKIDVAQVRSLLNRKGVHFEATRGIFTAATRPASR